MDFVADESVDQPIVERLRRDGHTVVYFAELNAGCNDDQVLTEANSRGAPLLTADKDFGELIFRLGRAHHGVVLLRLAGLSADAKQSTVSDAVRMHSAKLPGKFSVVLPGSVRIR
jgi:predicted nuclease of predicted toxin-antitoxin system